MFLHVFFSIFLKIFVFPIGHNPSCLLTEKWRGLCLQSEIFSKIKEFGGSFEFLNDGVRKRQWLVISWKQCVSDFIVYFFNKFEGFSVEIGAFKMVVQSVQIPWMRRRYHGESRVAKRC